MIYDLLIIFSSFFMTAPLEMVALTTSRNYLKIYLIDITKIYKIYDEFDQNLKFLCNLIVCEAQEGAE